MLVIANQNTDDTADLRDNSVSRIVRDAIAKRQAHFTIPRRATVHRRDLTSATGSGAALIGEDRPLPWGAAIRQASLIGRLGARFVVGRENGARGFGQVRLPRFDVASSARWLAEGATDTQSVPTLESDLLAPKRIAVWVEVTTTLQAQTGDAIENCVSDLLSALAAGIDSAALSGPGGDAPTGLLGRSDVTAIPLGTNGGPLSYAAAVDASHELIGLGLDLGSLAWILSPAVHKAGSLSNRETGQAVYAIDDNGRLARVPAYPHVGMPDTGTKGTGTGLGSALIGDFSRLTVVQWGETQVMLNPYSLDTSGQVRLTASAYVNVGTTRVEAFRKITDVVTG